jgi:hypothetical protein
LLRFAAPLMLPVVDDIALASELVPFPMGAAAAVANSPVTPLQVLIQRRVEILVLLPTNPPALGDVSSLWIRPARRRPLEEN